MSLIVALAISALGLSVRAIYENTHYMSGNQASDIVGVATTQVGYGEGGDGYTKYGDWYGLPYSDWCAMFVSWCADQAGVDRDVFPSFALCSAGADWFISEGRFHYAGSYQPQAGDLIFYASYGDIYHVGLVTGSDDYNVYSIEGNYNEAVYNVSYPLSYGDIFGYATPDYSQSGAVSVKTEAESVIEETVYSSDEEEEDDYTEDTSDVILYDDEEEEETDTTVDYEEEEEESSAVSSEETTDSDSDPDEETYVEALAGDANCDGVVNSADALLIQRYLAGLVDVDAEQFSFLNADVNASGEIDVEDALLALKLSVQSA